MLMIFRSRAAFARLSRSRQAAAAAFSTRTTPPSAPNNGKTEEPAAPVANDAHAAQTSDSTKSQANDSAQSSETTEVMDSAQSPETTAASDPAQSLAANGQVELGFNGNAPDVAAMADLITEKDAKLGELNDKYFRALAEMENVRNRSRRDVDNAFKYSIQGFAKDLLEVADNLNRALDNVEHSALETNPGLKTLFEGLQMTEKGLTKVFQKYGVEKMELPSGIQFNPNFHTALFQQESDSEAAGTIASIVSTGYMFKDRVLRPAGVGTYKASTTITKTDK